VGGRTYIVAFDDNINPDEVKVSLADQFKDEKGNKFVPDVKNFGGKNQLKITTKFKINDEGEGADNDVQRRLYEGLKPYFPQGIYLYQFISSDENKKIGRMQSIKVGPTIADDFKKKCRLCRIRFGCRLCISCSALRNWQVLLQVLLSPYSTMVFWGVIGGNNPSFNFLGRFNWPPPLSNLLGRN